MEFVEIVLGRVSFKFKIIPLHITIQITEKKKTNPKTINPISEFLNLLRIRLYV